MSKGRFESRTSPFRGEWAGPESAQGRHRGCSSKGRLTDPKPAVGVRLRIFPLTPPHPTFPAWSGASESGGKRSFAVRHYSDGSAPIPTIRGTKVQATGPADSGHSPPDAHLPNRQPVVACVDHGMIRPEDRSRRGPQMSATPDSTLANP